MSRVKSSLQSVLVLVIILSTLIQVAPVFSQAIIQKVVITSVDYSQFPDISVRAQVVGENRTPVTNLNAEDLIVTEDGQVVDFSHQSIKIGTKVVVVLDLGAGIDHDGSTRISQFEEMRTIVSNFLDTMDEKDGVELILVREDSTSVKQPLTNDKNALVDVVENLELEPTVRLSNGLDGVRRAFEDLKQASGVSTPVSVLFITPGIQSRYSGELTTYDEIDALLETQDIPIYTVLVGDETATNSLQNLVAKSRALFVRYTSEDSPKSIFNLIEAQRWQYQVSYRSPSSSVEERELKISARTESGSPPYDIEKFSVLLEPPAVLSMMINNGDPITRTAPEYDSNLTDIPMTEAQIDVLFYFPDGYAQRTITRAELLIDGQPHDEPLLDLQGEENISFTWDLRTYTNKGKTTSRMQVVLTDELGLQSTEEVQVLVEVFIPDKPQPIIIGGTDICESLANVPYVGESLYEACNKWGITPAQMLNMAIALAALIMVAVIWFKRDTVVEAGKGVGRRATDVVRRITKQLGIEGAKPKAYLETVKAPPDAELKDSYPIYGETPIGQNSQYADLIFDFPVVSGSHCKIHLESHRWTIEDDQSANGTYLNGKRLTPFQTFPLKNGDTIELTPIERGGICFKFTLAEGFAFGDFLEDSDNTPDMPPPGVITKVHQPFYDDDFLNDPDNDGDFDSFDQEF
jgi:hypothetical protein